MQYDLIDMSTTPNQFVRASVGVPDGFDPVTAAGTTDINVLKMRVVHKGLMAPIMAIDQVMFNAGNQAAYITGAKL